MEEVKTMKANIEQILNMLDELTQSKEINLLDIPSIDLYMDQITTFFDDKLGHLKRDENDAILTKTMINNYTKGKVLMPPNKKKYSKDHLIMLILIYNLKQVLSINDIHTLFSSTVNSLSDGKNEDIHIEQIYNKYLNYKKLNQQEFKTDVEQQLNLLANDLDDLEFGENNNAGLFMLVLMLIDQANLHKRMAEEIIDTYFKVDEKPKKKK